MVKFQQEIKPRSASDYKKAKSQVIYNRPEIRISSAEKSTGNPRIKKPRALTVDNQTSEAICSRRPNSPVLVTSPRKSLLYPPKEEKWSYTTTKF